MKTSGSYRKGIPILFILFAVICLYFPQISLGASEESGGGGVTVIPDGSFLIQIVNFLFAIWVLNILLYKPIRKILNQRKEKISGLELSIETSNQDAQNKDEAFLEGVKDARARGFKEKEVLLQQAGDEEKSIIADINRKAQEELIQIREKIRGDAEIARESLQKEVDGFADQITQKILGRAV